MRRAFLLGTLLCLASVAVGACRDVDQGPEVPVAIEFMTLPFPSVVIGDSLRDTAGVSQPLHALAFNVRGDTLHDFPFRYVALDTGVTIDSATYLLFAQNRRTSPVRIVAQAHGLQSPPLSLTITERPDTLVPVNAEDTLRYSLLDSTRNVSSALTAEISSYSGSGTVPVPAYPVWFEMIYPTDTTWAQIVGDDRHRSVIDTTDASGVAGRAIRIRAANLTALSDSVVVLARTVYKNVAVAGGPVRLVLRVVGGAAQP